MEAQQVYLGTEPPKENIRISQLFMFIPSLSHGNTCKVATPAKRRKEGGWEVEEKLFWETP